MFLAIPGGLLAISTMFATKKTGLVVGASIIVVLITVALAYFIYWWQFKQGRAATGEFFQKRQDRLQAIETLPYDMVWMERKVKELQDHTECDPAPVPAPTTSTSDSDSKAALENVADDMKHASNMVLALIEHCGLEDDGKDSDAKLGRFVHKENETMPDVDTSGYWKYQAAVLGSSLVVLAFILWGTGSLIADGSTGYKAMGIFLLCLVAVFVLWRLYMFFLNDGKNRSLAAYKDKEYQKTYKESYGGKIAKVNADIEQLASHTNLPALGSRGGTGNGNGNDDDVGVVDDGETKDVNVEAQDGKGASD